ncbi:MAG: PAS domain S-box protein [Deltaproteobacteria bacterium]|nr:PAS domain S-box protein [Deltaproteobacteria bacterium]
MDPKSKNPPRKSEIKPPRSPGQKPERRKARSHAAPQAPESLEIDYQAVFNSLGDAVLILEAGTGRILQANPRMGEMFGYSPEEVRSLTIMDLWQDEHCPERVRRGLGSAAQGEPQVFAGTGRDSAGIPFWVEVHLHPAALPGPDRVLAVMRDITGRKEMLQAIAQSEARFRTVIESSLSGVYLIQDDQFVYVNPRFAQIFGYRTDEIVGRLSQGDLVHPDDRATVTENIRRRLAGEIDSVHYTFRGLRKDGAVINVEVLGRRVEFLGRPAVIGTIMDITQRRQAEEQLRRRDAILQAVAFAGEKLLRFPSWEDHIQEILARLGQAANVSRVYIFELHTTPNRAQVVRLRYEWVTSGVTPTMDDPEVQEFDWREAGYEDYEPILRRGEVVFGTARDFPEKLQERWARQNIQAILLVPVFVGSEPWGVIGFDECFSPRQWSAVEIDALRAAAHTLGAVMQRQAIEDALRTSEANYREIFEGVTEGIAVQDLATFTFLDVNQKFCEMTGYTREEAMNLHYGDLLLDEPPYALEDAHRLVEKVIQEGPQLFEWRYRHRQGRAREVELILKRTMIGNRDCLLAVARDITARKQREAALRESQERFRQLAENIKDIFWLISYENGRSRLLYINPDYEEIWGRSIDRLKADPLDWLHAVHPEDRRRLEEIDQRFLHGQFQDLEYRIIRPNGEVRWISSRAFPVYDDQGKLSRVAGLGVDITELKLAAEALKASEENYRTIFNAVNDAIAVVDTKTGDFLEVNQKWCEMSGFTQEEARHLNVAILCMDDSPQYSPTEAMCSMIRALQDGPQIFEWLARDKFGREHWVEVNLKPTAIGGQDRLLAVVRDIMGRKQAETALRESEERYRSLINDVLDSSSVGTSILDADFKIVWANRALEHFFGLKREEIIGQDKRRLIHDIKNTFAAPETFVRKMLGALEDKTFVQKFECHVLPQGGRQERWLEHWSQPIVTGLYAAGRIEQYSDITARKQVEAFLQESEKQLRFLASQLLNAQENERRRISRELHDELGQALTLLKINLVAIEEKIPPEQEKLRGDCESLLNYIDQIIENVRRLSWDLSPTILEDLGLSSSLRHLLHEICKNHDIKYSKNLDELGQLFSPALQTTIYRIFQESLTNICKHALATRVTVDIKRHGKQVTFTLADNGVGFDVNEVLSRNLTERGLGLTAIQERVLLAGGKLQIWSQKTKGTRITFTFPIDRRGSRPRQTGYHGIGI